MTGLLPPAGNHPAAVVDGVDLDAVAAAARGCAAVDDLCPGAWGGVASYLPGREVPGVRVARDHVVISVRGRWDVPVTELARQIRAAVAGLVGQRRIDVVVADLADAGATAAGDRTEVTSWMTASPGGVSGASSSSPITPTAAVTPPLSPLASPNLSTPRPAGRPRGSW